ncbi:MULTISPECIES: hypothetical protein [Serratia]|nr:MULTISPECIES: hypothetical protein [Serratia]
MPNQFASLHAVTDLQRHGAQRQSIVSEAVKADLMAADKCIDVIAPPL